MSTQQHILANLHTKYMHIHNITCMQLLAVKQADQRFS